MVTPLPRLFAILMWLSDAAAGCCFQRPGVPGVPAVAPGNPDPTSDLVASLAGGPRPVTNPEQLDRLLLRRPCDLRHSRVTWRLNSGVPPTEVAAWAGHSADVLMRVYAKCMTGLEDVWISRMGRHPPPGRRSPGGRAAGGRPARRGPAQVTPRWLPVRGGAPSRIRTCAHGSGGRCSIP